MEDAIRAGCLLVATPSLHDPNFRRTVVLVAEHEPDAGTLGVVLNRPTPVPVREVLAGWADLASEPSVVHQGGPVGRGSAICVASLLGAEEPLGWRRIHGADGDVGIVDLDAPPEVLAAEIDRLRIFTGYAGWGEGQLDAEVRDGAWYVLPAETGDPLGPEPAELWAHVLRRQGGELALVATLPDDPTTN